MCIRERRSSDCFPLTINTNEDNMFSKQAVRILLIGDSGVGKTSLILSLVSEEFPHPESLPARAEQITIPAGVTPENIPTHIVDYNELEQTHDDLVYELEKASVICIVYSLTDLSSLKAVTDKWLPLIEDVCAVKNSSDGSISLPPVVLAGNKSDSSNICVSINDDVAPIMDSNSQIDCCIACSAKDLANVSELFYYSQKAVLNPTGPLYDFPTHNLSPLAETALKRIFKLCDSRSRGRLNDKDINWLQQKCFSVELDVIALGELKALVQTNSTDGKGIAEDGSMTLEGFFLLNILMIERGRHETTWCILRRFGYSERLTLRKDYIMPSKMILPQGSSTELSSLAFEFLTDLFHRHDKDCDGALSFTELHDLFSVCPVSPWDTDVSNTVVTNGKGWLTLQGFLSQWVLTAYLDVERAMELLAYLGYNVNNADDSQMSAIIVNRPKHIDWSKRSTKRRAFLGHVIGAKGVGKSCFLQGLLGRSIKDIVATSDFPAPRYAANVVNISPAQDNWLLLHEFDVDKDEPLTSEDLNCDVVILMYDLSDPNSFSHIARLYLEFVQRAQLPCLIVGGKSDRIECHQRYHQTPVEFCTENKLPAPVHVSNWSEIRPSTYRLLVRMALKPHISTHTHEFEWNWGWTSAAVCAGFAALATVAFFRWKS